LTIRRTIECYLPPKLDLRLLQVTEDSDLSLIAKGWVLKCSLELRKPKTAENTLVEERLLNDIIGSYGPEE